jgi:hypothetical protein
MYQWFFMTSVQHPDEDIEYQKPGLQETVLQILHVSKVENADIVAERVSLAGISQGCATKDCGLCEALWVVSIAGDTKEAYVRFSI